MLSAFLVGEWVARKVWGARRDVEATLVAQQQERTVVTGLRTLTRGRRGSVPPL
jgi:hypothetical protein